ncbi:hypothetical protein [Vitiosangium sp. GDMCC 1.1324]|uniref:hypothetical protein n=1 Tax=Vitiosangium sp. (strain GDMCC 1.1324) TaxID=2138576 RepID=UPI000D364CA0|nr:hypothetical protein [Vitiosangium sp. GDMCC 1.1324]PTL75507.1 hypothetical protein DAT35_54605 [Vitiosangium sp. GDMCC 1.1324]
MHALILALMLTQAATPPAEGVRAVVFMVRGTGLSDARGTELTSRISEVLQSGGVPLLSNTKRLPASCRANRACLLRQGYKLGASHVILVDAGVLMEDLAVMLDAVATPTGDSLKQHSFMLPLKDSSTLASEVAVFTDALRSTLSLQPPREVTVSLVGDPSQARLLPQWDSRVMVVRDPLAVRRKNTLLYVTGGGALLGAGAATVLGLSALQNRRLLDDARFNEPSLGRPASRLTLQDAQRTADRANAQLTGALLSTVLSVSLSAAATYLWLSD